MRRPFKLDGMVAIVVPNATSLAAKLFGPWWFPWNPPPRHLYHFDRNTLPSLLQQAGFLVVRIRRGACSLFFMASLERVWKQKCGMVLSASGSSKH